MRERFPYYDTGAFYPPARVDDAVFWDDAKGELGGFWTPDGGFVDDPQLAAHNLLHAAAQHGAQALFGAEVVAVERAEDRVDAVVLANGDRLVAPVVVNAAGPHSRHLNEMAGVLADFNVSTRPLRQEVHHVVAPEGLTVDGRAPVCNDGDLGTYFRPTPSGGMLIGGQEPECDPLEWLDDADVYHQEPTPQVWEAQTTRVARRVPLLAVPSRPSGVVGIYDVCDDWIPIYDRTSLDGYYVAIGTSGNQFKNAPVVGQLMRELVEACESGHDHDADPVVWHTPRTGNKVDLGHCSRLRKLNPDSTYSVLG